MEKGGRLTASDAAPFFQQLCGAVGYAHSLGLTHGNIKPSNVYLFEGRHVLLGDFGLLWDVRALDPSWSGSDVAAFEFLAPEVFDGRTSPASDIFSLGATLFATLTGHAPFHMSKLGELVNAARTQTPPSLSDQTPPLTGPVVALDGVVRQAMAKQIEQRYATAALLEQALEETLAQAAQNAAFAQSAQFMSPAGQQVAPLGAQPPAPPSWGAPPPVGQAQASVALGGPSGALGAPASPLGQLNPPFPPLGPMGAPDPAMEAGSAGAVAGVGNITRRVDPPQFSGQMVAPEMNGSGLDGPTMRVPVSPDALGDVPAPGPGDPTPRRGMSGRMNQPAMPIPQTPPHEQSLDANAQSSQFSATELGLPRLTTPDMAGLPENWRDLVTDESARRRHDPFAESESALAPLPPAPPPPPFPTGRVDIDRVATARVGLDDLATSRIELGHEERAGNGWDSSDPGRRTSAAHQPWEPDEPEPALAGMRRGAQADYDIERMTDERAAARLDPKRADEDEHDDTLSAQKVWTDSHTIVRGKRRSKTPFLTIVALLALSALEMAGLAVLRPDICVTHYCTLIANQAHRLAPGLQIPGVTAPVRLNPVVPVVSAVSGSSGQVTFTLVNTSSDPITWSTSPTLAWMTVSPSSGALPGRGVTKLTITVKPAGVAPGTYAGALMTRVGYGESEDPVVVTVKAAAALEVAQHALAFAHCGDPQSLTVSNAGGQPMTYSAAPSQASALSVGPSGGTLAPGASTALAVSVTCDATPGAYAVIIVSDGGSAQVSVAYN